MVFQVCFLNTNTRFSSDFRAWDIHVLWPVIGLMKHLLYLVPTLELLLKALLTLLVVLQISFWLSLAFPPSSMPSANLVSYEELRHLCMVVASHQYTHSKTVRLYFICATSRHSTFGISQTWYSVFWLAMCHSMDGIKLEIHEKGQFEGSYQGRKICCIAIPIFTLSILTSGYCHGFPGLPTRINPYPLIRVGVMAGWG